MAYQHYFKVNTKGKFKDQRVRNLKKIANEKFKGNVSEMINHTLNAYWGLDPETGDLIPEKQGKRCC